MIKKIDDISVPLTRIKGGNLDYQALNKKFKFFSVRAHNTEQMPYYDSMATQQKLSSLVTLFAYFDENSKRNLLMVFNKEDSISAKELNNVFKESVGIHFTVELLDENDLFNYLNSMSLTKQYNLLLDIMPGYLQHNSFSQDVLRTYGTAFDSKFYLQRAYKGKNGKLIDDYGAYHFYNLVFIDGGKNNKETILKLHETAFYPIKVKDIKELEKKRNLYNYSKFQISDSRLKIVNIDSLSPNDVVFMNSPRTIQRLQSGDKPEDTSKAAYISSNTDSRVNIYYHILDMLNTYMDEFLKEPIQFTDVPMKHISNFNPETNSKTELPNFNFAIDIGSIKPFLEDNFDIEYLKLLLTETFNKVNKKIQDKKIALWNQFTFEFIDRSENSDAVTKPTLIFVPNKHVISKDDDPYLWDASKEDAEFIQHLDIGNALYYQKEKHKYGFKNDKISNNLRKVLPTALMELYYKQLRKDHKLPAYVNNAFKNWGYIFLKPKQRIARNTQIKNLVPLTKYFSIVGGFIDADMNWHEMSYCEIMKNGKFFLLVKALLKEFLDNRQTRWLIYDIQDIKRFAFIKNTQINSLYQREFYDRQKMLENQPFNKEDIFALIDGINDSDKFEFIPDTNTFKQAVSTYIDNNGGLIDSNQLKQLLTSKIELGSKVIYKKSGNSLSRLNPELNRIAQRQIGRDIYMSKSNDNNQFISEVGGLLDVNYILNEEKSSLLYCAGMLNPQTEIPKQPVLYEVTGDTSIVQKYLNLLESLLSQLIRFGQTSVINIAQKYILQSWHEEEYREKGTKK